MEPSPQEVTQLLHDWRNGDASALDKLIPLVYDELRSAAKRQMAHQAPGHTLQTTAVINEVYLRLVGTEEVKWQDRAHFIAFCASVMRNILVDHFRHRRHQQLPDEAEQSPQEQDVDVLRLHDALDGLAKLDSRASQVVELKFFGGLTMEEIAEVLNVSLPTVKRDWRQARRWLKAELEGGSEKWRLNITNASNCSRTSPRSSTPIGGAHTLTSSAQATKRCAAMSNGCWRRTTEPIAFSKSLRWKSSPGYSLRINRKEARSRWFSMTATRLKESWVAAVSAWSTRRAI